MFEIKICSDIVCDEEQSERVYFGAPAGVTYNNIADLLASMPIEEDEIHLRIYSPGGNVREGWAIVDALRGTGKKISATIEGDIASMASVVLLAASERKAMPHARILIHRPYVTCGIGTLNDKSAEYLRSMLAEESNRVLDFYAERTGADRARLEALMDEERYISAEEALELGFITEILAPLSARLNSNKPNQNQMKNKSLFNRVLDALKGAFEVVAYELTTATGETLTIDIDNDAEPSVGDAASPDGEHVLPDGRTIVVADGVITEIREAEEETTEETTEEDEVVAEEQTEEQTEENAEEDEVAQLKERIAELEKENEELKKSVKSEADSRILNAVAVAGGESWLKKATSSQEKVIAPTKQVINKEERETWATRRKAQLEKKY